MIEKLPLFVLAAAVAAVTIGAQASAGAMVPLQSLPLWIRLANVPVSYVRYIGKLFWPTGLAVLYPYQFLWPAWTVAGASLLLVAATLVCVRLGPQHRYALVGWLWYLVVLLPVIGLLQAGVQAIADRFTYVALIGLSIVVAWGTHALAARWRGGHSVLAVGALMVVAACLPLTWQQVGRWRNSYSVFEHALAVTRDNAVAHEYLGKALLADGHLAEAAAHFEEQVRLLPFAPDARLQLGALLAHLGRPDAAAAVAAEALPLLPPEAAGAYYNLGNVEVRQERFNQAATSYRMALLLAPEWPEAHHNLGIALASLGKSEDALAEYAAALRLRPDFAEASVSRGLLLAEQGRTDEALAAYLYAIQLRPGFAAAHRCAGLVLAQQGRTAEAIAYLQEAIRLAPDDAEARQQLARLQGGSGQ